MKLSKYFSFLVIFMSFNSMADSMICIGSKSAALLEQPNGEITLANVDISDTKYLLSNKEGSLRFKEFGEELYVPCTTKHFCTCGTTAWCGQVLIDKLGNFTYYVDRTFSNNISGSQIVKGKCEEI